MVLPLRDRNPTILTPYLTWALLGANVVVFVLLQPHGEPCAAAFYFEWAAIPRELLSLEPLEPGLLRQLLGPVCAATVGSKSVLASSVTAMFLHANWLHLAGNMLFLWVFGNNVEDRLGHVRFLLFYVIGGLIATYSHAALNPGDPTPLLGASGAVAAILGAYLICFPRAQIRTYLPFPLYVAVPFIPRARMDSFWLLFAIATLPAWAVLLGWFLFQVTSASSPASDGVAYAAHVAGFVAGIVLVLLLDRRRARRGHRTFHPIR